MYYQKEELATYLDWKEDATSIVAITNPHLYGRVYKTNYWKGKYNTLPFIE